MKTIKKKKDKENIITKKITFRVGKIYTDEEENNLIQDLDEEIIDNNNKENNNINILINNDYILD